MIRHEGRFPARLANDLRGFYEGCDNLWWPVGITGASAPMAAQTDGWAAGPTSFVCDGGARRAASWGVGGAIDLSVFYRDDGELPFWADGTTYVTGSAPYTAADRDATTACGAGTFDQTGLVDPAIQIQEVTPFGNGSPGTYTVGLAANENTATFSGGFALDGVGFGPGDLLKRMKGLGATCVEAKAEVRFVGMGASSWSLTRDVEFDAFAGTIAQLRQITFIKNGVTVRNKIWDASGSVTTDESASDPGNSSTGPVSLILVGIEEDSATITDVNGNPQTTPSNNFVSLASTSVADTAGEYTTMDVTGLVNALLNDSSRSSSYILFPSVGVLPDNLSGLAALAESTRPTIGGQSATYDSGTGRWRHSFTATGAQLSFTSFSFGLVLARFRLPSGILQDIPGPLILQPPREAAP